MQFLKRLNFQTKINLVTFLMVLIVVICGAVAIEKAILPVMETDVQNEGWRIAHSIVEQAQDLSGKDLQAQLRDRLRLVFQVRAKLLYVEFVGPAGAPVFWMGDAKYRSAGKAEVLQRRAEGRLLLRTWGAANPVYEVVQTVSPGSDAFHFTRVRVGISARSVRELSIHLFRVLFIVTLLILGVSLILTRWFAHMITRPVESLLRMTHLLAKGQLEEVFEEVQETPPCLQKPSRTHLMTDGKVSEVCSSCALSSTGGCTDPKSPKPALSELCDECEAFRHSQKDELSRLLFAFQYMAARIRDYQDELRKRHEFEERLREACPDGIIANDRSGRIILYNTGAQRLLGYVPDEVVCKLPVKEIYPPDEAYRIKRALLSEDYGGPGILLDYTTQVIRKDGAVIPIRLSATIIYEKEQEVAVVGYFHDLTELQGHMNALVEKNDRLNTTNDQLARLNRHYLEMLSFVTHELKSPIANSYMSANALRQEIFGTLAAEQKIMVEAVCRNLDQSMEMIRHYLDLSRIEKDEMPVQPQPTKLLAEVIEPVLKGLAGTILERGVEVVQEVPAQLEWTLDPELFRAIMNNLLSNALKYGAKAGKIRVSARPVADRCRLEVWNSGPGIKAEDQVRLFRKFQRLTAFHQSSVRGTGLGLFITKTVVERHGGKIWIESEPGEWVEFIIELPRL